MFVEVKARDGRAFGDGAEAVTLCKRRRIAQMALDYLTRHHLHDMSLPLRRRRRFTFDEGRAPSRRGVSERVSSRLTDA